MAPFRQLSLLDAPRLIPSCDPNVKPKDRRRLRGQNERLLRRLIEGPTTNSEMQFEMRIGNHTGRLSDLKKAGCDITATDQGKGLWVYELKQYPEELIG